MTKSELLSTIESLFWEHSFSDLSMDQIALKLGMKKASLYYHFPSKEAMFRAVLEGSYEKYREFLREVLKIPPICWELPPAFSHSPRWKLPPVSDLPPRWGGLYTPPSARGIEGELIPPRWGGRRADASGGSMSRERGLLRLENHLPYNKKLSDRAKELRKNMTEPEKKLWYWFLRSIPTAHLSSMDPTVTSVDTPLAKGGIEDMSIRFLRQRPIDNFIVDFYCPELRLVIEIDGESHFTDEWKAHDIERTAVLEWYGLGVLRFTNDEVMKNFEGVCETILEQIENSPWSPTTPLAEEGNGLKFPFAEEGQTLKTHLNEGGNERMRVGGVERLGDKWEFEIISSLILFPFRTKNLFAIASQKGYCQIDDIRQTIESKYTELEAEKIQICRERFGWNEARTRLFFALTESLSKRACLENCEWEKKEEMIGEIRKLFFTEE